MGKDFYKILGVSKNASDDEKHSLVLSGLSASFCTFQSRTMRLPREWLVLANRTHARSKLHFCTAPTTATQTHTFHTMDDTAAEPRYTHTHRHTRSHTAIPKFPYTGPGSGVMMIPLPKCPPPCLLETEGRAKRGASNFRHETHRLLQLYTHTTTQAAISTRTTIYLLPSPMGSADSFPAATAPPQHTTTHWEHTSTHARTYVSSPSNIGRRDTDDGCFQ